MKVKRIPQSTVTFNITTHSDDWDAVDGIPRWVWRLDDECVRIATHGEDRAIIPALCIAYLNVYELHKHTNRPKLILADWLEQCRRARNKVVIPTGVPDD